MAARVFGPGPHRLLYNDVDIAPLAVAESYRARQRGLLGTDSVVGALWITRCPSVHMIGMRYPIDVAVVDQSGRVLLIKTLKPWIGATWPRRGASATIEAAAGAMIEWGIEVGGVLAIHRL